MERSFWPRSGATAKALAGGLGELEENFGSGWTNLLAAINLARKALVAGGGKGRQKSMLILSDGYPTAPGSPRLPGRRRHGPRGCASTA